MLLDGHRDAKGNPLRERTKIRHDAPLHTQRNDNRKLAEQLYHARMTALAKGDAETHPVITFGAFLDWWTAHKLPARRGKDRESELLPRFRSAFGELPLTAIDRHRVSEWITARLATPTVIKYGRKQRVFRASPRTVNREVAVLKTVLQAAVPKYLEQSPLYGMRQERTTTPKRRMLREDEEARLLAVLEPDDKALFLIALDALVRLGDVIDLKWKDVHDDTIWIADPKAGGGFTVPLSSRAQSAVAAIRPKRAKPDAYLFARRRKARTERDRRGSVRQMLERACRLANVPYGRAHGGVTFHWATRRTGLTRMLVRKVDLGTAQKVGRWKTANVVLEAYHELIDDEARAAVETIGRDSGVRGVEADQGNLRHSRGRRQTKKAR
jgi:integrase